MIPGFFTIEHLSYFGMVAGISKESELSIMVLVRFSSDLNLFIELPVFFQYKNLLA